tara:strand:+ start:2523 stop:2735 length:213 start_codon:yes stop_codon:yes gene_type:complete
MTSKQVLHYGRKILQTYYIGTVFSGFYIYGYETSIPRDKAKDTSLFLKYIAASPATVPYYLYHNGISGHK